MEKKTMIKLGVAIGVAFVAGAVGYCVKKAKEKFEVGESVRIFNKEIRKEDVERITEAAKEKVGKIIDKTMIFCQNNAARLTFLMVAIVNAKTVICALNEMRTGLKSLKYLFMSKAKKQALKEEEERNKQRQSQMIDDVHAIRVMMEKGDAMVCVANI